MTSGLFKPSAKKFKDYTKAEQDKMASETSIHREILKRLDRIEELLEALQP